MSGEGEVSRFLSSLSKASVGYYYYYYYYWDWDWDRAIASRTFISLSRATQR